MDGTSGIQLVLNEVANALSSSGQSEAVKALTLLLNAQSPVGCWEHSGNFACTAIQTVQALDALLTIDNEAWLQGSTSPIRRATAWLCKNQRDTGEWGQDPFDTAEVLRVLLLINRKLLSQKIKDTDIEQAITRGETYLRQCVANQFKDYRGTGWYGPAFWTSSAVVFYLKEDFHSVRKLVDEVRSFRRDVVGTGSAEDGSAFFECPEQANDENLRIWNVAHAIIGLLRVAEHGMTRAELTPFVRWLERKQHGGPSIAERIRGSWGNDAAQVGGDSLPICTYSAIFALHQAHGNKASIDAGVKWFDHKIRQATAQQAIGNITLCAAAVMYTQVFDSEKFKSPLPLDTIFRLIEAIEEQSRELQAKEMRYIAVAAELDKIKEEQRGYITIRVRREPLGLWALVGIVLGTASLIFSIVFYFFPLSSDSTPTYSNVKSATTTDAAPTSLPDPVLLTPNQSLNIEPARSEHEEPKRDIPPPASSSSD